MTTSQFGGLHGDALTRAQQYVTSARDTIKGTNCPCCGQKCKTYRRTITSTMAVWLIALVRRYEVEPRYYSTSEDWSLAINKGTGDVAKLRYWGVTLARPHEKKDTIRRTSGLWMPTRDGILWAHGKISIVSHVLVFNNKVLEPSGELLTIGEALGTKFDYQKLMEGTL